MAYFDYRSNTLALEMAVVGTHSSGKTSVIEYFNDQRLESDCDITSPFGLGIIAVNGGFVDMASGDPDLLVPVLTIEEAARAYGKRVGDMSKLGANYSANVQRQIDVDAAANIAASRSAFSKANQGLRQLDLSVYGYSGKIANLGVILGDRERLDGRAYSQLRTPGEDNEPLDAKLTLRKWFNDAVRTSNDCIFIADETEVPFSSSIDRAADINLRRNIQAEIRALYGAACSGLVMDLIGSVEQRADYIKSVVSLFFNSSFVARHPVTTLLEDLSAQRRAGKNKT
jgi:hypothetical protein